MLCPNEFTDSGHWPRQLYNLAVDRRMIGEYVMIQQDLQTNLTKADPIGMGSYNSDSHNVERIVSGDLRNNFVRNEGDMQVCGEALSDSLSRDAAEAREADESPRASRAFQPVIRGLLFRPNGAAVHDPGAGGRQLPAEDGG